MLFGKTDIGKKAETAVDHARSHLERQYTEALRDDLRDAGWPPAVFTALRVRHSDDSGFDIDIPDSVESKALDLEYGTETRPPSGALRRFRARMGEIDGGSKVLEVMARALS